MALFDNVTFEYYTETLGRSEVPTADDFNKYALENKLFVKRLIDDGVLFEHEAGGYDDAVCLLIETDYKDAQTATGAENALAGENTGDYSYSLNTKAQDELNAKNASSTAQKKYKWLSLYCDIVNGV